MTRLVEHAAGLLFLLGAGVAAIWLWGSETNAQPDRRVQPVVARGDAPAAGPEQDALRMIREGRQTFRYDTFGDESVLGRRPPASPGHRRRETRRRRRRSEPEGRSRGRAEGRHGGAAAGPRPTDSSQAGQSRRPGHDAGPAEAGCGRRREGFSRTGREAAVGRDHLCHLPLHGGRRLLARHRPPAGRLAEPRPRRRQDHHAGPGAEAADRPTRE